MKEYKVALLRKKTGQVVRRIEFKEDGRVEITLSDSYVTAHPLMLSGDVSLSGQVFQKAYHIAETLNDEEDTFIPVLIEYDIKVTDLFGNELNL